MIKELLQEYRKKFTNNQLDLAKEIEVRLGVDIANCLVSLLHFERTSQKEIDVISRLIEQFKPLKVEVFSDTPKKVIIGGYGPKKHHRVEIIPQFKVKNPFPKGRIWSMDLVINLYRHIDLQYIEICSIGIEYDGDPSHYLESGIKKAYLRDSSIASDKLIQPIRICPDDWKKDQKYFITVIKKYFEKSIQRAEKIQYHTVKGLIGATKVESQKPRLEKCPICIGEGVLALDLCPVCKGIGGISHLLVRTIDISNYDEFDCPECTIKKRPSSSCRTCIGRGFISRDKAIEIAINRE